MLLMDIISSLNCVEAGEWLVTVCNHLPANHPLDNIDHSYYIERAQKIVDKVEYNGNKRKFVAKNQLSLF